MQDRRHAPVDALDSSPVPAVHGFAQEPVRRVDGQVDVHVPQVQEEGLSPVLPDEPDAVLGVALGQAGLVRLLLDHGVVEHEGKRGPVLVPDLATHVVRVRQAEVVVEAVIGGQESRLVPAVPLPDHHRRVPGVSKEGRDGVLLRVQPEAHAREQDVVSLEAVEPDPGRVAASEQRTPRRAADGACHVEVGESHSLRGQRVDRRCPVQLATHSTPDPRTRGRRS